MVVFGGYQIYDDVLPAQISANGMDFKNYRLFGATGGVGDDSGTDYGYEVDISTSDGTSATVTPIYIGSDPLGKGEYVDYETQKVYRQTENLYDGTYMEKGIFSQTGSVSANDDYRISQYMELGGNHLVVKLRTAENRYRSTYPAVWYDENKTRLKVAPLEWLVDAKDYIFKYPPVTGAKYVRIDYRYNDTDIEVFETWEEDPPVPLPALPTAEGEMIVDYAGQSIVPSSFYGKYINNPILPIYIGSDPLGKDEYIDYQAGKVYRRTAQLVQSYRQGSGFSMLVLNRIVSVNLFKVNAPISVKILDNSYQFAIFGVSSDGFARWAQINKIYTEDVTYDSGWKSEPFQCNDTTSYAYGIVVRKSNNDNFDPSSFGDYLVAINDISSNLPETYMPYLQLTDPPVALPALPTCEGTTIVDYAGSGTAPEKVYFEYKGGKQP
jgi:hypothetical protein